VAKPLHRYQTFIKGSAEQVWEALVNPEFTKEYFHAQRFESALEPGAPYRMVSPIGVGSVEGTVEEVDRPRRLVMTWRVLYDPAMSEEPPSRVEWELHDHGDGVTKVVTIHRDLGLSPLTSGSVGDGWNWVLGSLKSFVETGSGLARWEGDDAEPASVEASAATEHRRHGIDANNSTWELLDGRELSDDEVDDVLGRAYAAAYHWRRAAGREPVNDARASWLVSHVHAVLGQGDLALHHADRCAAVVASAGLGDFDLAYAHEARARALACLGRLDEAAPELAAARAVPIADDEDRKILDGDLASGPWYGLEPAGA
jgi:uncharacterized protein YndB with AHSA1/START domain